MSFLKRKQIISITAGLIMLVFVIAWWVAGRQRREDQAGSAAPLPVKIITVAEELISDATPLPGVVIAAQRAELSAKIMGRITEVYVREGEPVIEGQMLARLEAADLSAAVDQARANVGVAGAAFAQAETASALQKVQSRARIEQAAEALKTAEARLSATLEGARKQERASAAQFVAQAEAELRSAESNYQRFQKLYENGAISAMEVDARRLGYEVAKARLESARQQASLTYEGSRRQEIEAAQAQVASAKEALRLAKASVAENRIKAEQARMAQAQLHQARAVQKGALVQYGYSLLVAPFSGVLVSRFVDPGDLASPGEVLLVVEDVSRYQFEVQVPESSARFLKLGQVVPVALDTLDHPLTGRVAWVTPGADATSHTVMMKVALEPSPGLTSGLYGRLYLLAGSREAVLLPRSAVVQRGQLSQVFVIENERAVLRLVTLGETSGGRIEILSGLQAGERVATEMKAALHDGQRVKEAQP